MDMFEKVDKLRERADVSYEEAKDALERSNQDILDAMILLEREGKTRKEGNGFFSTGGNTDSAAYDEKQARKERIKENGRTFGEKVKELFRKSTVNYLVIEHKGETLIKLPILAFILILLFAWYAAIIAVVVSLFCNCKYSFVGEDDLKAANDVCDKAGEIATQVRDKVVDEYNKL
ncbi:MAG: DUF4342 domain-containing protein [Lachnospiraceae bacterium]|nr:DUF4342 domain-containing protein [Lachnospiraceae bacterium]